MVLTEGVQDGSHEDESVLIDHSLLHVSHPMPKPLISHYILYTVLVRMYILYTVPHYTYTCTHVIQRQYYNTKWSFKGYTKSIQYLFVIQARW